MDTPQAEKENKIQEQQIEHQQSAKQNESKSSATVVVRMKRKANEDPLEKLIIEGELNQKKQRPNPLFGINFLEKMLNDLSVSNNNTKAEKENQDQKKPNDLFKEDENENMVEKKQYVLKLVDNEAVKQIKEVKLMYAEQNRKKARDKLIQANRKHRFLEMTVDSESKQVKVEKTKLNQDDGEDEDDYAYYEVEERKLNQENQEEEDRFQNIGSLLQKEQENIMKVQSGLIHLIQTNNPELFDGEFESHRSDDFNDNDSQDSNRESADQNDYPDEEREFGEGDNEYSRDMDGEDYDDYNQEEIKYKKKSSNKKSNIFQNSLHGIYLGNQSSDDNSIDEEEDDDNGDEDYEDDFNKKYNNYYHKKYDNDFDENDFE